MNSIIEFLFIILGVFLVFLLGFKLGQKYAWNNILDDYENEVKKDIESLKEK